MEYNLMLNKLIPSASMKLNDIAKKMERSGRNIINLSIGEPEFELEEEIKEALFYSVKTSYSHYTNKQGIEELRERILQWHGIENDYDIENILVTPGAKYAIYILLLSLLNFGDEVIILKPYWVSYVDIVTLCGGKPIIVECKNDFSVDWDLLNSKISSKTKAIIINNPNNPSGYILNKENMIKLYNLCKQHSIYLIADEIYSTIVFDEFNSFIEIKEKDCSNVIVINGVSKSLACTGLRIGYIIANNTIIKNVLKIHQHIATCAGSLEQKALSMLSKSVYEKISKKYRNIYFERKKFILENVNCKSSFNNPKGTFYMLINIRNKYQDSNDASSYLLENFGIATVPGVAYGLDDYIRISMATSYEKLKEFIGIVNKEKLF
ncbi:aminotransferase class I/II-fold pyridoxal phosphate-dependent enzyme [Aeribacillus sp. FSL K6-1305]|uniref:pyridoxal phosphate-dependent aminotransferase n=1 Tax=Aeribacillus sp. FSL K6-1305 TaxID=2954569 RepID=UPI0030FD3B92